MALLAVPDLQAVTVHGHRRAFVKVGEGPPLLLLHGLGCDHRSWLPVLPRLAQQHTVIAPDLLGHGASDKPRADYSLGGYANGMRDLLTVLGIERVTVVGHSFGGGVAMQFAYQYPERTNRLVLVSPGGLGHEVTPLVRALTLPGASTAIGLASWQPVHSIVRRVLLAAHSTGLSPFADVRDMVDVYDSLRDPGARYALVHVIRAAVDWQGQVVSMRDRGYLAAHMPVAVIWGTADTVIPAQHAESAQDAIPNCRVTLLDGAAHFPHRDQPERFAELLIDFMATTTAARHDRRRWRALLRQGAAPADGRTVETAARAAEMTT